MVPPLILRELHCYQRTSGYVRDGDTGTGCGLKSPKPRMQPLTRGPEADETKTMTAARPQHACVRPPGARQHRAARSSCAHAPVVRSATLNADTLKTSEDSTSDALFTQELMASMQPITSWARALSARDLLTDFSGGRTLDECGVAQSSSSELATQRHPS